MSKRTAIQILNLATVILPFVLGLVGILVAIFADQLWSWTCPGMGNHQMFLLQISLGLLILGAPLLAIRTPWGEPEEREREKEGENRDF